MAENKNTIPALVQILTAQSNGFLWRHYYVLATPQEKEAYLTLLLSFFAKEMKDKGLTLDQSTTKTIRQLFADPVFEKGLFENDMAALKSYVEEFFKNPVIKASAVFPKLQSTAVEDKRLSADFFQVVSKNVPVLLPSKVVQPAKQLVNWTVYLASGKISGTSVVALPESGEQTANGRQPIDRPEGFGPLNPSGQEPAQPTANRLSLTAVTLLSPLLSEKEKQKALIETSLQMALLPEQALFQKSVPLGNMSLEDEKAMHQITSLEKIPLASLPVPTGAILGWSLSNLQISGQTEISISTLASQIYLASQQQITTSITPTEQGKDTTAAILPNPTAQFEGIRDMALLAQLSTPPSYDALPQSVRKFLSASMATMYQTADTMTRHHILQEAIVELQNQVKSPNLMPAVVAEVASGLANFKGKVEVPVSGKQEDQKRIQELGQDRKPVQNIAQQIGGLSRQAQLEQQQPEQVQVEEEQREEQEQTTSFSQQTSKWAMAGLGGAAVAGAAGLGGLTFLAASQTTLNTTTTVIHIISTSFFH